MNWEELKEAKLPIVLYGMGYGADRILAALAAHGLQAAGVFASDEFVRGQVFHSFPVLRYEEAKRRFGRMLVLLALELFIVLASGMLIPVDYLPKFVQQISHWTPLYHLNRYNLELLFGNSWF